MTGIRTHAWPTVVILAAASLLLAGCGSDEKADSPSAGSPASGAVLPGGGLTVAEAIATDAKPPLSVSGWVVGSGEDARLCSAYDADATEPCGEPSLGLEGEAPGKDGERVSVLGAVEGYRFVVSTTVQG